MKQKEKGIKAFNMRMPHDLWVFLKKTAVDKEVTMTDVIITCLSKYKKKSDSKLTSSDTNV